MTEVNAILALSYRDLMKFLRDVPRVVSTFVLPFVFIGVLGGSVQFGSSGSDYDYLTYVFTGVFAQTLFMSAANGIISLIEDRANDFSQEIFVSPISRYSILFGKILGESLVALAQGVGLVVFGLVMGVQFAPPQLLGLALVAVVVCLFGGAFGVLVLSNLRSQQAATQVFNFIMLPQFFLAGVFTSVQALPSLLDILSRLSPMRYAVDLTRGVFYLGRPDYDAVVLANPAFNLTLMAALFAIFLVVGTFLFVRGERNR
jgi:ABC-2 type transport system permease protein